MKSRPVFVLLSLTAVLLAISSIAVANAATQRRPPGAFYFGPTPVWTDGTTGDLFQPLSDPMPSSSLVNARIYFEITEGTGGANLRSRPALRYSADDVGWDTPAFINSSYVTGNGIQPGTAFVDLTSLATAKAWVQSGVQLHDNAQGNYEFAHAVLIVEPKGN